MNKPLVTVYITNYNYELYITQAVESVLSQSFQDFEIIIIDDGSTDNSKQIIEEFSKNNKIKVIFQQNKGLNVTNNIALKVASGKYIMRLDADDYLEPNALQLMCDALEKDQTLGLVFPDYYMVDRDGNALSLEKRHSFDKEVNLFDMPAHGACTMIRTDFLKQVGGYDEQYKCQDGYELWIKFISKFKVNNINTPLFHYRQHGDNLTTNEEKILSTRIKIKENHLKKNKQSAPKVVTIIPVRGSKFNSKNICFQKIANTYVLDLKIKSALETDKTGMIVISSPDEDIEEHIKKYYSKNTRVIFHSRDIQLARLNISLDKTILSILENKGISNYKPEIILVLSIEYPVVNSNSFEDAINTMLIFNSDSLISVRPETGMLFQHDGSGMNPILDQDKFTKLEREALYKYEGGIIACSVKNFRNNGKLISGKTGHIVISRKEALHVKSDFDLKIINQFLRNQIKL